MEKLKVRLVGATGAVGQNYIIRLQNHPWFEIAQVTASPKSAGKTYAEAVKGKWLMDEPIPGNIANLIVEDASKVERVGRWSKQWCDLLFSSYEGTKEEIQKTEEAYAAAGIPVISNNSAHRWTEDVPMIIPEINYEHLRLIERQQLERGWKGGFIVTKPNCSIQSFMIPLYVLMRAGSGYGCIKRMYVTTLQALSGAGYPGVSAMDVVDNVIPHIPGEEEKTEKEPLKIPGSRDLDKGRIVNYEGLDISSICTRVDVRDGHLACVQLVFDGKKPQSVDEVVRRFTEFKSYPSKIGLPSAPNPVIIYNPDLDRPQPRKDRNNGKGMAITVGKIKITPDGMSFVGLSHNTNRGAAGGAILTAELLFKEGYFERKIYE